MGDDCWSNVDPVDPAYRTISSLRELIGAQEESICGTRRSSEEDIPASLRGVRSRRSRSGDQHYFVSTPLERFVDTRRSKEAARMRVRKRFDSAGDADDKLDSDGGFDSCLSGGASVARETSACGPDNALTGFGYFRSIDDSKTGLRSPPSIGASDYRVAVDISGAKDTCEHAVKEPDDSLTGCGNFRSIDDSKTGLRSPPSIGASDYRVAVDISSAKETCEFGAKEPDDSLTGCGNFYRSEDSNASSKSTLSSGVSVSQEAIDSCPKSAKGSDSAFEESLEASESLDESHSIDAKVDQSDKSRKNRSRAVTIRCSDNPTKHSSPDRFRVTRTEFSDRFTVSNPPEQSLIVKDVVKSDPDYQDASNPYKDVSPLYRDLVGQPRRRLSQCPEEDETEEEPVKRPVLPRLHMDKLFFDSSLVEIKSPASSTSTIDTVGGSAEEVWIRRSEQRHRQDVSTGDAASTDGSTMSSTTSRGSNSDSTHSYRSESTWGGGNPGRQMVALVTNRRQKSGGRHSVYHTVTGAVGGTGPPRVQQTHIPSIFEVFRPRSKSDANPNQKKPSLMGHMRSAMAGSGGKGGSVGDEVLPNQSGSGIRNPVAKVMNLFRNRSQSAASADEKRKARAAALQQQQQQQFATSVIRRSSLDKRRLSLGTVAGGGHRGSDPVLDPNHAAILFRDSRGLPVADPFLEKVNISDLEEDESQIFVKFFRFHKCYDLIPTSAKLVVFDTQLLVKKAFFALVYNGVRAAPLWDSAQNKFVGMLTITDFIKILKMFYGTSNGPEWMQEMESHKLVTWRKLLKDEARELVSISPEASLFEAISMLVLHRIHRLPVVDPETNNVLYILTHKRILKFLFLYINDLPRPSFLSKSLSELRVGTFEDVATAKQDTTIISALDVFMDRRVSALPIVDQDNKLVDIYAKFDVINLAAEKTYDNLDVSLKQANEHRNEWFEGVHKCSMDDSLYTIIERIVRAEVHRLVVTDDEERVIGVISLSDILEYLVLRPARDDLLCRSESPSISESLAYSNTQEDTIAEGEEDEERERSPAQSWTPTQWPIATTSPPTSA